MSFFCGQGERGEGHISIDGKILTVKIVAIIRRRRINVINFKSNERFAQIGCQQVAHRTFPRKIIQQARTVRDARSNAFKYAERQNAKTVAREVERKGWRGGDVLVKLAYFSRCLCWQRSKQSLFHEYQKFAIEVQTLINPSSFVANTFIYMLFSNTFKNKSTKQKMGKSAILYCKLHEFVYKNN